MLVNPLNPEQLLRRTCIRHVTVHPELVLHHLGRRVRISILPESQPILLAPSVFINERCYAFQPHLNRRKPFSVKITSEFCNLIIYPKRRHIALMRIRPNVPSRIHMTPVPSRPRPLLRPRTITFRVHHRLRGLLITIRLNTSLLLLLRPTLFLPPRLHIWIRLTRTTHPIIPSRLLIL